jgi:hypothetical protein
MRPRLAEVFRHGLVVAVAVLLAAGCAETAGSVRTHVVLIIHRGEAGLEQVLRDTEEAVLAAASEGGRLDVYLLDSGSAASMRRIDLSERVNGGDFRLKGANDRFRMAEARRYTYLTMSELEPLIAQARTSPTGADLFGAVPAGVDAVGRTAAGEGRVVLVTGGGVHRTAALDLVAADVTPETAAQVAAQIPPLELPAGIGVEIYGVGRFEGAATPVLPRFAAGVTIVWETWCHECVFR